MNQNSFQDNYFNYALGSDGINNDSGNLLSSDGLGDSMNIASFYGQYSKFIQMNDE